MNAITIKGHKEINAKLRKVTAKVGKSIIRKAFRAALKPMQADIKSMEPLGETGTLRKAARIVSGRGRPGEIKLRIQISRKTFKGRWYGVHRDLGVAKKAGSGAMRAGFRKDAQSTKADAERGILDGITSELSK